MSLRKVKWLLIGYVLLDLLIGYAGVIPLGLSAAAQFTTVTGTVTDPNGLPYALGTITPLLVASGTPVFSATNQLYYAPIAGSSLDLNGHFIVTLADNSQLSPAASKWNFTVCSGTGTIQPAGGKGPVCFTLGTPITISGSSQDITANLHAVALALSNITGTSATAVGSIVQTGLMAEYRMLPTESAAALVDYSGNGQTSCGTVGTAPTIISGSGGLNFSGVGVNGQGAICLPAALNSALFRSSRTNTTSAWVLTPFTSSETIDGAATLTMPTASSGNFPVVVLQAQLISAAAGGCTWKRLQ